MVAACVFAFGCCLSDTAAAPSCFEACSFIFFSLGQSCIITYSVDTVPVLGGEERDVLSQPEALFWTHCQETASLSVFLGLCYEIIVG